MSRVSLALAVAASVALGAATQSIAGTGASPAEATPEALKTSAEGARATPSWLERSAEAYRTEVATPLSTPTTQGGLLGLKAMILEATRLAGGWVLTWPDLLQSSISVAKAALFAAPKTEVAKADAAKATEPQRLAADAAASKSPDEIAAEMAARKKRLQEEIDRKRAEYEKSIQEGLRKIDELQGKTVKDPSDNATKQAPDARTLEAEKARAAAAERARADMTNLAERLRQAYREEMAAIEEARAKAAAAAAAATAAATAAAPEPADTKPKADAVQLLNGKRIADDAAQSVEDAFRSAKAKIATEAAEAPPEPAAPAEAPTEAQQPAPEPDVRAEAPSDEPPPPSVSARRIASAEPANRKARATSGDHHRPKAAKSASKAKAKRQTEGERPRKAKKAKVAKRPRRCRTTWVVRPGDTLARIAEHCRRAKCDDDSLYAANRRRIADQDLIYPGQRLRIPGTCR